MKFDIFCEVQKAGPFSSDWEHRLIEETIEQSRAADRAGFEVWWQVEHHGSPEFSYSAAPDLLLGAIAHNTRRLRVGHAGVLAPFKINHPLKIAERAATLDILSNGRFELGLARGSGKEWDTFGVDYKTARPELKEAFQIISRLWQNKSASWNSDLLTLPERQLTPRPIQKPHPALWQTAGSPDSFRLAGELGVGVLGTTLLTRLEYLKAMLDEYDAGIAACRKPVGAFVNNQKAIFTFVHVAESRRQAIESGAAWSALWYVHQAPVTFNVTRAIFYDAIIGGLHPNSVAREASLKAEDSVSLEIRPDDPPVIAALKRMANGEQISFEEAHEVLEPLDSVVIGDPDFCARKFRGYEDIGTDRMMCLVQFGSIPQESILRSIRLIGAHFIQPVIQPAAELRPAGKDRRIA